MVAGWVFLLLFFFFKSIKPGLTKIIIFFLQLVFITFYVLCVLQSWLSISTAIKSMKETRIYIIIRTISIFNSSRRQMDYSFHI